MAADAEKAAAGAAAEAEANAANTQNPSVTSLLTEACNLLEFRDHYLMAPMAWSFVGATLTVSDLQGTIMKTYNEEAYGISGYYRPSGGGNWSFAFMGAEFDSEPIQQRLVLGFYETCKWEGDNNARLGRGKQAQTASMQVLTAAEVNDAFIVATVRSLNAKPMMPNLAFD